MSRRMAWTAGGVVALLAMSVATAASATAGQRPAAAPGWHIVKSVQTDLNGDFTAVVATGATTGWGFDGIGFSSAPTAWERSGGTWKKVAFPGKTGEKVDVAAASSPSNVWAVDNVNGGEAQVVRWNGAKWSVVKVFADEINAISVLAPDDVWVFGVLAVPHVVAALGVWHYNGHTWSQVAKNISGGSALSATDVWGFTGTSVEHWNGHTWKATSVSALLPPKQSTGLNLPQVVAILALSDSNVFAVGNGNQEDDGGPVVVLHYNGHSWARVARGLFGFGPEFQQVSSDGGGGLWLAMTGPAEGGASSLLHYAAGKLTKAATPGKAGTLTTDAVAQIPGSTQQLAGGFTHAVGNLGANVVAVLLQYS
ncbi:hypothetical protein [Trebonia sp.]|uniref:hypothetical protein n=1 Tax=Trebonia sp. TaxID=2767075 RepID=UPI00262D0BF2|nr:hypothetical protein [Trebonia sp.]